MLTPHEIYVELFFHFTDGNSVQNEQVILPEKMRKLYKRDTYNRAKQNLIKPLFVLTIDISAIVILKALMSHLPMLEFLTIVKPFMINVSIAAGIVMLGIIYKLILDNIPIVIPGANVRELYNKHIDEFATRYQDNLYFGYDESGNSFSSVCCYCGGFVGLKYDGVGTLYTPDRKYRLDANFSEGDVEQGKTFRIADIDNSISYRGRIDGNDITFIIPDNQDTADTQTAITLSI